MGDPRRQAKAERRLDAVLGVPAAHPAGAELQRQIKAAIDDPARFTSSKAVGAHFGLTPKKYQSGEIDVTGAISKVGDTLARGALYEAAQVMLTRVMRFSALNDPKLPPRVTPCCHHYCLRSHQHPGRPIS